MAETHRVLRKVIELPGRPLVKFDIAWVDHAAHRFYLADRSNARIAVIDTDTEEYVGAIGEGAFTGLATPAVAAGPNGVLVIPELGQLWAGDGDSTVKVFEIATGTLVKSIHTGGKKRVDELAYSDSAATVLVANDQDSPPFACLINTADLAIVATIEFPDATNGLHQPLWDAGRGVFYLPVTEVGGDPAVGEIAVIDPRTGARLTGHRVLECQPAGLTMGPGGSLCIACSKDAVAKGFEPRSLIMDTGTGLVIATVPEVGGTDEAWYNPGDNLYYLAASGMTGGPVLGIIDAATNRLVENVPTGPDSHSVAVDPGSNHAFVALTARPDLPQGGVGVYGLPAR